MLAPRSARAAVAIGALLLVACGPSEVEVRFATAPFSAALRPDHPSSADLFRYEPGDAVESFDSPGGAFRIHFTRAGVNQVPAADLDASGTPDFVEQVASVYDDVLTFYRDTLGFRAPLGDSGVGDNGGDGRFDVYLLDFAGMGDGAFRLDACLTANEQQCIGYMVQENDFSGYGYPSTLVANTVLGSHEFFHAVQAAYDVDQGGAMSEGTATWASEQFEPTLSDFEHAIREFLAVPDRPLDVADDYGAAIIFQFLGERFSPDFVRQLWDACVNGTGGVVDPYWLTALPQLLTGEGTDFATTALEFAEWNLHTGGKADPALFYAGSGTYPSVAVEAVGLPYQDDSLRSFYASTHYLAGRPIDRTTVTAALVPPAGVDLSALRLGLAVDRGQTIERVVWLNDLSAGAQNVAVGGAERVILLLVNTAVEGPSVLPGVCFGTPAEVASCRVALGPPVMTPPAKKKDGGCAATTASPLLLVGLLLRRRSRSRSRFCQALTAPRPPRGEAAHGECILLLGVEGHRHAASLGAAALGSYLKNRWACFAATSSGLSRSVQSAQLLVKRREVGAECGGRSTPPPRRRLTRVPPARRKPISDQAPIVGRTFDVPKTVHPQLHLNVT